MNYPYFTTKNKDYQFSKLVIKLSQKCDFFAFLLCRYSMIFAVFYANNENGKNLEYNRHCKIIFFNKKCNLENFCNDYTTLVHDGNFVFKKNLELIYI